MATSKQAADEFVNVVAESAKRLGRTLKGNLDEVRAYAAERMQKLAQIAAAGEPGYAEALVDARDNLMLKAGLEAIDGADAWDAELWGTAGGALALGARLLAPTNG